MDVFLGLPVDHADGLYTFLARPYGDDVADVVAVTSVIRLSDGSICIRLPNVEGERDFVEAKITEGWTIAVQSLPTPHESDVTDSTLGS